MAHAFRFHSALTLLGCGLLACAPAAVPAKHAAPASARAPESDPLVTLAAALRSIPRPEPVLAALPADARKRLDQRFVELDAERRLAVHTDDSPLVESLPLLHLASGGSSPRALYVLSTTSAGTEELSGLLGVEAAGASTPDLARLGIVRELAQRAALNFLRDRAADVAVKGKEGLLACIMVGRVAEAVGRRDLMLAAQEVVTKLDPNPENWLHLAHELAFAGFSERAETTLQRVTGDPHAHPSTASLALATGAVNAARFVATHPAPKTLSERIEVSRSLLQLERKAEVRQLLASDAALAPAHLALAVSIAEAKIDRPLCPGLPPGVGTSRLCALAFHSSAEVDSAHALLETAWKSGAGRDETAIERYAALGLFVPWQHAHGEQFERAHPSRADLEPATREFSDKIHEVVAAAPSLSGLDLYVDVMLGTFWAEPDPASAEQAFHALEARALGLAQGPPRRFARAGVLVVAAALSQRFDVSRLIDAVPVKDTPPSLLVQRAALEAWVAATSGAKERMESARAQLADVMSEGAGSSLDRAQLVLMVSEADAVLSGSQSSYQLLSRVAGQLLSESIPPGLAFRAVLDAAGALSRGPRSSRAEEVLTSAAEAKISPDLRDAAQLLSVIQGYRLLLSVHDAQSAGAARAELAALTPKDPKANIALWFELWGHELDARVQEAACHQKKQTGCPPASKLRQFSRASLDARVGAPVAGLFLHGTLAGTTGQVSLDFRPGIGLEPLLGFDPTLLAVPVPSFTAD